MPGRIHLANSTSATARPPSRPDTRPAKSPADVRLPRQRDGGTVAIDHHHRLAGGLEGTDEIFLHLGQFDGFAVIHFTFLRRSDSADVNNQIRVCRVFKRFRGELRNRTRRIIVLFAPGGNARDGGDWGTLRECDFDIRSGQLLDAAQDGNGVRR